MPKTSTNYSNTIIYKIVCKDLTIADCYVGHTTNFTKRKNYHKNSMNKGSNANCYVYTFIRENGGWDNWEMVEIEKIVCKDGNEARARERYWYELLNATLNRRNPIVSNEEKKQNNIKTALISIAKNKEKVSLYQKEYRIKNKEKLNEYLREYRKNKN
jgi:hypothetical protein